MLSLVTLKKTVIIIVTTRPFRWNSRDRYTNLTVLQILIIEVDVGELIRG